MSTNTERYPRYIKWGEKDSNEHVWYATIYVRKRLEIWLIDIKYLWKDTQENSNTDHL